MEDVYIVDAIRTPIGKFGRKLAGFSSADLGAIIIENLIERNQFDSNNVDIVIMGQVIRGGSGMNPARQAALKAGIPKEIDAITIDMVCASGMAAIITGSSMIKAGDVDLAIVGGMESMSRSPFIIPWEYRWGVKLLYGSQTNIIDSLVYDGLTDPFNGMIMAQEADMLAKETGISREELEVVAYNSHKKAANARNKGYFDDEIIPVKINNSIVLEQDEGIREDTTLEKMKKLPTIFPNGLHTAATASQISDGASALLIANEKAVDRLGLKVRAKILGYSWIGTETWRFPEAPIHGMYKLLNKLKLSTESIDYFENNEAFAISTIIFEKELDVSRNKINVFGGAIALGHPLGASGARITTTLLNVLEKKGGKLGAASICHGIGGATALIIERRH